MCLALGLGWDSTYQSARPPSVPGPALITSQTDFLPWSPSPAQARLLAPFLQSQGPQPRSPSSLRLGLPILFPLPPTRPLHSDPHHSPVRPPCLGSRLPATTRLLTRVPGSPHAAPRARWGRRDPPCRTFPGAAVTEAPPGPALQAWAPVRLPSPAFSLKPPASVSPFPVPCRLLVNTHPIAFVAPPGIRAEGHSTAILSAVWTMLLLGAEFASSKKPTWLTPGPEPFPHRAQCLLCALPEKHTACSVTPCRGQCLLYTLPQGSLQGRAQPGTAVGNI